MTFFEWASLILAATAVALHSMCIWKEWRGRKQEPEK